MSPSTTRSSTTLTSTTRSGTSRRAPRRPRPALRHTPVAAPPVTAHDVEHEAEPGCPCLAAVLPVAGHHHECRHFTWR